MSVAELKCPKCLAPMRSIERNNVVVERCTECGGIFLDRGELERLTQAENTYVTANTRGGWRDDDDDDDDDYYKRQREHQYRQEGQHAQHGQQVYYDKHGRPVKKKKRGFLEDLFDFGD